MSSIIVVVAVADGMDGRQKAFDGDIQLYSGALCDLKSEINVHVLRGQSTPVGDVGEQMGGG